MKIKVKELFDIINNVKFEEAVSKETTATEFSNFAEWIATESSTNNLVLIGTDGGAKWNYRGEVCDSFGLYLKFVGQYEI